MRLGCPDALESVKILSKEPKEADTGALLQLFLFWLPQVNPWSLERPAFGITIVLKSSYFTLGE